MKARGGATTKPKGRTPHRVGSMVIKGSELENPQTMGQRIAARRLELGYKLDDVAKQITLVHKTGKRRGQTSRLSRPAYNMYEIGQVEPTIPVLKQIAQVLKTSAGWLAFGEGDRNPIEQVTYNPKEDTFVAKTKADLKKKPTLSHFDRKGLWSFDAEFLRERFDVESHEIAVAQVHDYSPSLKPGDLAIVRRDEEPGRGAAEFMIGYKDEMVALPVSRPARGGPYRVYSADRKSHEDVDPGEVNILGRVIGKIGDCD